MTKEEFLKLTGIREMSDPDYEKVEHAYMSVPNMDKQTFCELYVNNQPELLNEMALVINNYVRYRDCLYDVTRRCLKSVHDESLGPINEALNDIEEAIGTRTMLLRKIEFCDYINTDDMRYIKRNLK